MGCAAGVRTACIAAVEACASAGILLLGLLIDLAEYVVGHFGQLIAGGLDSCGVIAFHGLPDVSDLSFDLALIVGAQLVAQLLEGLFGRVYHAVGMVADLYLFLAGLILVGVLLCIVYSLVDLVLAQIGGSGDSDLLLVAGALVLGADVYDTVAVDVAIPMAQYLRYAGTRPSIYENDGLLSDITLSLADGVVYPSKGWYSYTQKDISSSMGTIVLVVKFANPDYTLKPGQFARVTANVGPSLPYVVVPQRAVTQMQDLSSVWVVGRDSTAEYRRVTLGRIAGDRWCILSGVEPGEWVVTAGIQKLHNGQKVIPTPINTNK